jgi:hypothetical protein
MGLYNGSMIMKDRETGNLWSCYNGVALYGPLRGEALPRIPAFLCQLSEWLEEHPDSDVLQWIPQPRHTDGRHGHGSWFDFAGLGSHPHAAATMLAERSDDRLPASELVLGIARPRGSIAFPLTEIHRLGCLIHERLEDEPIVVWSRSPASAWMGAFRRQLDGEVLEFEVAEQGFRDTGSGSLWTVEGRAVAGRHAGKSLQPLDFVSVKWPAWSGFYPDTKVYKSSAPARIRVDPGHFEPLFTALRAAGFEVAVQGELLPSSLPPGVSRGLVTRIGGDPFHALHFATAGDASDYAASRLLIPRDLMISFFPGETSSDLRRHAAVAGPVVLESFPDRQYADAASLVRLAEDEIHWSPVLGDPKFKQALAAAPAPPAAGGTPTFADLLAGVERAGYAVRRVKPMLRQWLRATAVSGCSAEIQGDRFLIYKFPDQERALAYREQRHHTVQAGVFVLRSDPPDQYQVASEQTVERPIASVHWSPLLEDEKFVESLGAPR